MSFEEFCKIADEKGGVYLDVEKDFRYQAYLVNEIESSIELPYWYIDEINEALEHPEIDKFGNNIKLSEIENKISKSEDILRDLYDDYCENRRN